MVVTRVQIVSHFIVVHKSEKFASPVIILMEYSQLSIVDVRQLEVLLDKLEL